MKNRNLSGKTLICDDQKYKLYKIKPSNRQFIDIKKIKPEFEFDFRDLPGNGTIPMEKILSVASPLSLFESRGDFVLKQIVTEKGNIMRVKLNKSKIYEAPGIQFGFYHPGIGLNLNIEAGDLVGFQAYVRMSKQSFSEPELFIQDKTKTRGWSRETIHWKKKKWKNIFLTRKIRDGFTDIQMGIVWEPESDQEWLEIKRFRIYVKKQK